MKHIRVLLSLLSIFTVVHANQGDIWRDIAMSPIVDLSKSNLLPQETHMVHGTLTQRFQHGPEITSLNLSGHFIDYDTAQTLLSALQNVKTLETLSLRGCFARDQDSNTVMEIHELARAVGQSLKAISTLQSQHNETHENKLRFKKLDLSHNRIDGGGFIALMNHIESIPTLEELNLSHNPIRSAMYRFERYLQTTSNLKKLDLSYMGLKSPDVSVIIRGMVENQSVTMLRLCGNKASHSPIMTSLQSDSALTSLDFSHCGVKDSDLNTMKELIQFRLYKERLSSTQCTLYLGGNDFSEDAKTSFAETFTQAFPGVNILYETSPDTIAHTPQKSTPRKAPKQRARKMSLSKSCPDMHHVHEDVFHMDLNFEVRENGSSTENGYAPFSHMETVAR